MEQSIKLMIIDDDLEKREKIYSGVFSNGFELVMNSEPENLFLKIKNEEVDGYLVDIVLDNWKNQQEAPQELIPVLEKLPNDKPIFLVSRQYQTLLSDNKLTVTLNTVLEKNIKISSFFVYQDFEKEAAIKSNPQKKNYLTYNIENSIRLHILHAKKIHEVEMDNSADIAVIAALPVEMKPFTDLISERKKDAFENTNYEKGFLNTKSGKRIKVVCAIQENMGTVDAALTSMLLVQAFSVKHIFMIGVCGGRESRVDIGDVIIPSSIVAFQKGKITEKGLEANPEIMTPNINVKQIFGTDLTNILDKIHETYLSLLRKKEGRSLDVKIPSISFNEMACGENVINKEGELDRISKLVNKPKLSGVDMESYSIYRLHKTIEVKTVVIKSVMDLTHKKSDKFKEYAAYVSANFLERVLHDEIYQVKIP